MATVKVENKTYTVDPLYQWDQNQTLEIRGLSLATVPEVHFTNTLMDRAIVRPARMDAAGIITTQVPNSMLQKASRITVYLCTYEGTTFKTLHKIEIPVRARQMPSDYTFQDDAGEIYSFNALETQVANALTAAAEAKSAYSTAAAKETAAAQSLETAEAAQKDAQQKYTAALETLNGVQDGTVFLKKSGDSMSGPIAMGGNQITGLADPTDDTGAVPKYFFNLPLLWENTEAEMLPSDITLDLAPYRFILVEYILYNHTDTDNELLPMETEFPSVYSATRADIVPVGAMKQLHGIHTFYDGEGWEILSWLTAYRPVYTTTEGVNFRNAEYIWQNCPAGEGKALESAGRHTKLLLPKKIYGIK